MDDISSTANPTFKTSNHSGVNAASSSLEAELGFSNLEEAWKVTANHAIASLCVEITMLEQQQAATVEYSSSSDTSRELFLKLAGEVTTGGLSSTLCEAVRSRLVQGIGYQFANFLFEKSNLRGTNTAWNSSVEEKRTLRRQTRAWNSRNVPEDKPVYWKQVRLPS